jgi:hypothetical protein
MKLLLAAPLLLAAVACGSTAGSSATGTTSQTVAQSPEVQRCDAEGRPLVESYSNALTLVAALPTTAGTAAHWEMTKNGPNGPRPVVSRWAGLPTNYRVLFCYFDGDFANFSPPGPRGAVRIHERALVFVTEGQGPWLSHIGPKATNPLTAP